MRGPALPSRFLACLAAAIALGGACQAQEVEDANAPPDQAAAGNGSWIDRLLARLGAADKVDLSKGIDWGILPGPFYNPEMGLGLGMAAIGLYKPANALPDTQLSTLNLRGFITTKGAVGLVVDNETYFGDDGLRLRVSGGVINMPTAYWGIGYDNAVNSANEEKYTRREFFFEPRFEIRLLPYTYAGAGLAIQNTQATSLERGAASAIATDPNGPSVFSSGVSFHLAYDSRDFIPNPYKGQAAILDTTIYRRGLGSNTDFEKVEWSYDIYHRMRERDVLAFDLYGHFSWGDVPWNMLAILGENNRMRGYFMGQYRDRNMMATQVEYRWHIAGRHGMVFWGGAGAIAPKPGDLFSARWLPTAGVGYRFEFKPRVNVRFDVGFGRQTHGVYFQINEAF